MRIFYSLAFLNYQQSEFQLNANPVEECDILQMFEILWILRDEFLEIANSVNYNNLNVDTITQF